MSFRLAALVLLFSGCSPLAAEPQPCHRTLQMARSGRPGCFPRVRPVEPTITVALDAGYRRSRSFRRLAQALETSDVIVHITTRARIPGPAGMCLLIGTAGSTRNLRIVLEESLPTDEWVALLGHELQHAVEIATASEVRDQQSVAAYYGRHGLMKCLDRQRACFDTLGAQRKKWQILAELRGATRIAGIGRALFTSAWCESDE